MAVIGDGGLVAQWVATGIIGIGLLISFSRNGKAASKAIGALENEVKNVGKGVVEVKGELTTANAGIVKVRDEIGTQREHCAGVVAGFDQRLKNQEKKRK